MEINGTVLILDNFRVLLKDYSLDIQDIVRSAILDGVDISGYLKDCRNDPFKLDQIRLGLKVGLNTKYFSLSGESIFQVRKLYMKGTNISMLDKNIQLGLSEEHMKYLIEWVSKGISISKIDVSIIPKNLLEVFDYGLCNGFDMSEFNTGVPYNEKYAKLCLHALKNEKSVSLLLEGDFSLNILELLVKKASSMSASSWEKLLGVIYKDKNITFQRVNCLIYLCSSDVEIGTLQEKNQDGSYVYSEECLNILCSAYKNGLDLSILMKEKTAMGMKSILDSSILKKKRKISGRIVKN